MTKELRVVGEGKVPVQMQSGRFIKAWYQLSISSFDCARRMSGVVDAPCIVNSKDSFGGSDFVTKK